MPSSPMAPCRCPYWRSRSATSSPRTAEPLKTLLAALASALFLTASADALDLSAPCAACVTWRASPDEARALADTTGRLEGLDVLVAVESAGDAAPAAAAARALAMRGAATCVGLPPGYGTGPL